MARQLHMQRAMNVAFNPAKLSTEMAKGQPQCADSFLAILSLAETEAATADSADSSATAAKRLISAGASFITSATSKLRGQTKPATKAREFETANTSSPDTTKLPNTSKAQGTAIRQSADSQTVASVPDAPVPTDTKEPVLISYLGTGAFENSATAQAPQVLTRSAGNGSESSEAKGNTAIYSAPAQDSDVFGQVVKGMRSSDPGEAFALPETKTGSYVGASENSAVAPAPKGYTRSAGNSSEAKGNTAAYTALAQDSDVFGQVAKGMRSSVPGQAFAIPEVTTGSYVGASENSAVAPGERTCVRVAGNGSGASRSLDASTASGQAVTNSETESASNMRPQPVSVGALENSAVALANDDRIANDASGDSQEQTSSSSSVEVANDVKMPLPEQADTTSSDQSSGQTLGNAQPASARKNSLNSGILPVSEIAAQPLARLSMASTRRLPVSQPAAKPVQVNSGSSSAALQPARAQVSAKLDGSQVAGGEKNASEPDHSGPNDAGAKRAPQTGSQAGASLAQVAQDANAQVAASVTNQSYAELFKNTKLSVPTAVSPAVSAQGTGNSAAAEKNSSSQEKNANEFVAASADQSVSGDAALVKQVAAAVKTDDPLTQNMPSQSGPVVVSATGGASNLSDSSKGNAPAASTSTEPHAMDEPLSPKPETNATTPMGSVQTARLVQNLSETEWRVGIQAGEFGKVDIHTSISQSQISARIYVEHDELSKALAGGLPQLHEKLSVEHRMDAQVELFNSGSSYSSGAGRQQHQQQQRTMEQNGYVSSGANEPASSADTLLESSGTVSATGVDMHV